MRKRFAGLALAAMSLSACVVVDASRDGATSAAVASETIRYETGACFGTCPVYTVTIAPDGKGTFEGKRFTEEPKSWWEAKGFTVTESPALQMAREAYWDSRDAEKSKAA